MKGKDMNNLKKVQEEYNQPVMNEKEVTKMKQRMEEAKKDAKKGKRRIAEFVAAAAVLAFVILPNTSADIAYAMTSIPGLGKLVELVTFREYQYEDERNHADVKIDKLTVSSEEALQEDTQKSETLKKTTDEINQEIADITDKLVNEFKENRQNEEGFQEMVVKTDVICTTEDYFTLKLICYQGAGSGAEWDYFYTIDLNTGERLQLKDLFVENSDYKGVISENIKQQMREQMQADESVKYWLDDPQVEEWNFKTITDDTSFYLNEDGEIVICFNEGDVGHMSMGTVEFTIPKDVTAGIMK